MSTNDLTKNWLFWVLIVVTVINIGSFMIGGLVIDTITNRVIEKLQKEYSPSPYGPGLDPDKVDPRSVDQNRAIYLELTPKDQEDSPYSKISNFEQPLADFEDVEWQKNWEHERGFKN